MSTLTIVAPPFVPTPRPAPGSLVDRASEARPKDVPRPDIVVDLSAEVKALAESEKQDSDEKRQKLRSEEHRNERRPRSGRIDRFA